ncbi:MAG TPA: SUMF1/EgtB/PvdO family nonheme iron enzyme [Kofleriaceae bacterium]|nr:SUMF1/EgtB/PvdO family nonheme iron enzyme [Kofleriaceae bacterium]
MLGVGAAVSAAVAVAFARKEEEARASAEAARASEEAARASEVRLRENQREMKLAAADMGRIQLELEPFDWSARDQQARRPLREPTLTWKLRAVDATDGHLPGKAYKVGDDMRRTQPRWSSGVLVEEVEVRSGSVFIEVNRGGDCAPSMLYLRRLPGYVERGTLQVLRLKVPTCDASREGMVEIAAGPYLRSHYESNGAGPIDKEVVLPAYRIDRTEITRGAFAQYSSMVQLTGDEAAPTDYVDVDPDHTARIPVVGVSFFTARAYCRYMGKDLPTLDQWQKAFRGGLEIDGMPNTDPKRLTPWLRATSRTPANIDYGGGRSELVPVDQFPDDESPYHVLGLAGNVSEWTLSVADTPRVQGLRWVLGGNWGSLVHLKQHRITWRNSRYDKSIDFGIGMRCVGVDTPRPAEDPS